MLLHAYTLNRTPTGDLGVDTIKNACCVMTRWTRSPGSTSPQRPAPRSAR